MDKLDILDLLYELIKCSSVEIDGYETVSHTELKQNILNKFEKISLCDCGFHVYDLLNKEKGITVYSASGPKFKRQYENFYDVEVQPYDVVVSNRDVSKKYLINMDDYREGLAELERRLK